MFNSNVFDIKENNGVYFLSVPLFEKTGLVNHGFSTRLGGVSRGRYSKMNISFTNGDDRENVQENCRRLLTAIGSKNCDDLVLSRQEHTDNIRIITREDAGKGFRRERDYNAVDGLITDLPGIPLVTLYADCVPLIFLDPVKKVIASSHSGWKGTVLQIGKKTVQKMQSEFGCDPGDIIAAILPCIGKCCYEVDTPLFEAFSKVDCLDATEIMTPKGEGKYMLDLPKANEKILIWAGIRPENLTVTDVCTCCNADTLHSHRATGGHRGNLAAVIELK